MTAADRRLVLLHRAHARLLLVEAGEIDIDDAITDLADAFHWLVPCACVREIMDRWERDYPPRKRRTVR
jgi:hypothetical protein